DNFNFHLIPKNMLLVDDYIFYPKENQFRKGSRVDFVGEVPETRTPIARYKDLVGDQNLLINFILFHIVIFNEQKMLMPTCTLVYKDDTFTLESFDSSINTTVLRKISEISKRIENGESEHFFYVTQMTRNGEGYEILNFNEFTDPIEQEGVLA